jgi:hypothetical protein
MVKAARLLLQRAPAHLVLLIFTSNTTTTTIDANIDAYLVEH